MDYKTAYYAAAAEARKYILELNEKDQEIDELKRKCERLETQARSFKGENVDVKNTIIAVDFDNTIAYTQYPKIIAPNMRVIEYLRRKKAENAVIILWTCREGEVLECAVEWCKQNDVPIDLVNENFPERIEKYKSDSRKINADIYIDDKAMCFSELRYEAVCGSQKSGIYSAGIQ